MKGENKQYLNVEMISQYLGVGGISTMGLLLISLSFFPGVRIEDVVAVTAEGPVALSACAPKEIDEIEALMTRS